MYPCILYRLHTPKAVITMYFNTTLHIKPRTGTRVLEFTYSCNPIFMISATNMIRIYIILHSVILEELSLI